MVQTILKTSSYNGKYVALKSFADHSVIASGTSPKEVYEKAQKKGVKDPVISFIPTKDMVQIY